MSLTSIISTASSALSTTEYKIAVSNLNVANASDPNYTRKTVQAQPTSLSSTVSNAAVVRAADAYLSSTAVSAAATSGYDGKVNSYMQSYDVALGSTSGGGDVSSLLDTFQASLSALSSSASNAAAKAQVVSSASDLAHGVSDLSGQIQSLRTQANTEVADTVTNINASLNTLASLNDQIATTSSQGGDISNLQDQRDAALESLSSMLGVTAYTTADNALMVYSSGGDPLLGTSASQFSYAASSQLSASAAYPGQIGGVMLNGKDVTTSITSGSLGALITLRDTTLVGQQDQLDALAGALITQANAITNAGGALPAPNSLSSTTAVAAGDPFSATGVLRVAVTDQTGKVLASQDLDLSTYATVGDLVAGLNSVAGMSATIGANGSLTLTAASSANGVSLGDIAALVAPSGSGVSDWLGFNDLFSGTSASDIAVSARLASDTAKLPTAVLSPASGLAAGDIALASGDGGVADQLSALLSAQLAFPAAGAAAAQTTSLQAYAAGFVSGGALTVSTASDKAASSSAAYDAATSRRQDQTAVNIDEELALVTQYQSQYQANAQMIATAKALFDTLITMVNS